MIDEYRDIPLALRNVAGDWFDGSGSAMRAFWLEKPVDAALLAKEAAAAAGECVGPRMKDRLKLQELAEFASAWVRKERAEQRARAAMVDAARAGYGAEDLQAWQEEAFRILRAERAVEAEAAAGAAREAAIEDFGRSSADVPPGPGRRM